MFLKRSRVDLVSVPDKNKAKCVCVCVYSTVEACFFTSGSDLSRGLLLGARDGAGSEGKAGGETSDG